MISLRSHHLRELVDRSAHIRVRLHPFGDSSGLPTDDRRTQQAGSGRARQQCRDELRVSGGRAFLQQLAVREEIRLF